MLQIQHQKFLEKFAQPNHHYTYEHAPFSNPNMSSKELIDAFNSEDPDIKVAAVAHPNAPASILENAVTFRGSAYMRQLAATHPNATHDVLEKAITDPSYSVRIHAIRNKNMTPYLLNKAYDESDSSGKLAVAEHSNADEELLKKAASHQNDFMVREAAMNNPNATNSMLFSGMFDKHLFVRNSAKHQLAKRGLT